MFYEELKGETSHWISFQMLSATESNHGPIWFYLEEFTFDIYQLRSLSHTQPMPEVHYQPFDHQSLRIYSTIKYFLAHQIFLCRTVKIFFSPPMDQIFFLAKRFEIWTDKGWISQRTNGSINGKILWNWFDFSHLTKLNLKHLRRRKGTFSDSPPQHHIHWHHPRSWQEHHCSLHWDSHEDQKYFASSDNKMWMWAEFDLTPSCWLYFKSSLL